MHPLERILNEAKKNPMRIVLPEATDPRMLEAARRAADEKIAHVILISPQAEIETAAKESGTHLDRLTIVDQSRDERIQDWSAYFAEKRKHKGLTVDQAEQTLRDPLFFGAMMVHKDAADGMVAGAVNTTGNVIRSALQIVGVEPGIGTVSSCFMMIVPDCPFGVNGTLMYGDCGVVPDPNPEQLADIAISTAGSMKNLVGAEAIVAMLSFSTMGSASHPIVEKVIEATKIAKEKRPDLRIEGELQADAALIESIGKKKAPESTVAGQANTLIFPDLNAGNIAYKLTERLAKAEAYGPLLQGLAQPINDLSRGCSANDIFNTIAITCVQAQAAKN